MEEAYDASFFITFFQSLLAPAAFSVRMRKREYTGRNGREAQIGGSYEHRTE